MRNIILAVNICTYHRRDYIEKNISKLLSSLFFLDVNSKYYGRLHIFVVDNGAEIPICNTEYVHYFHNRNTGGSGGFQRGLEEIRNFPVDFTHVIFMDDDVDFELESFYILFDFLQNVDEEYQDNPVAGRMFCMDKRNIQYTAAEIWNQGDIKHVEFLRDTSVGTYKYGTVVLDSGADYGGWWFCCYPYEFVRDNDILPFFIHCDDVEYGLRCGKAPIIIEGVQVWHETYDKKVTPLIQYYDTRNPLFVNEIHNISKEPEQILKEWKKKISDFHVKKDWDSEYFTILGLRDYLRGIDWLYRIDASNHHNSLCKKRGNRIKNAVMWRYVQRIFVKKYKL
ncbi:MAG: glycosyltransferase [Lachnospiraceae bacterium]